MTVSDLPAINASLNAASTVLIALGWIFIRAERKMQHIVCMISALVTSTAFLTCYLIYHAHHIVTYFTVPGWPKALYYLILFTHIPLAFAILPLIFLTVIPAIRAKFDKHRRWGKITMPIWLYVSVTGVLVYFMLYQWFPPQEILQRRAAPATTQQ